MTSRVEDGVVVAQLGARRHYAVPRALHRSGLLACLVTDACANVLPWNWLDAALPRLARPKAIRRLLGRRVIGVPDEMIHGFPWFAFSAAWDAGRSEARTNYWARRNAQFARLVVSSGMIKTGAVYAFNGAALEIFRHARECGLRTILDQTAAPWRWNARLLREEVDRWPGWEDCPAEVDESCQLSAREEAEWELADQIVCGSPFVVSAMEEQGGPRKRCVVVPYAGPESSDVKRKLRAPTAPRQGPLRVLFVGTLQLRKGIQYLHAALQMLPTGAIEIRLVGPSSLSPRVLSKLREEVEVVGVVPRAEVELHYDWADALVLPTLSEGSANVVLEAMARGLPVVTTPNAGSIVRDGENGLLVPIRDAQALASALLRLANDEALRRRLGWAATKSLPGFEAYASSLSRAVEM